MSPVGTLLFLFLCSPSRLTAAEVEQPPRITNPPSIILNVQRKDKIYFDTEDKKGEELPCRASGSPPLTFQWTKNGKPLDISDPKYLSNTTKTSKIVRVSKGTGTILMTELKDDDVGIYQCAATNAYGTSLSRKVHFAKATKRTFNSDDDPKTYKPYPSVALEIPCNPPENDPSGKVRWIQYYDEGEGKRNVELNDRISVDDKGNLYFANIQESDSNNGGLYACEMQFQKLNMYVEGAFSYIKVQKGKSQAQYAAELVYSSKENVVALKGQTATFKCIFSGNPTPQISWVRINGKLNEERMVMIRQRLVIKNTQYEDAGAYECRGENSIVDKITRKTFRLQVESLPEWIAKPVRVDAGVEESAVFECAAEGKPTPQIQWYINGQPFESLKSDPRRVLSNGQLRFLQLSLDDAQVIQCNASNKHGYLWADVPLSILAYKPEIKASFTYLKVAEKQKVVLPCETDGKPTPSIFWKRGGQKMEGERFKMLPTGNLTIQEAELNDAGTWTCFTENKYGKERSSGELVVRKSTKIERPPSPSSQSIVHGNPTQFICQATTDAEEMDKLTISWLKDGQPIDHRNDPRISLTGGHGLVINGTTSKDTGVYTCVASNGLDSDSASARLEIIAPPDPPTDVSFAKCLKRKATVSWKPGSTNFSPITKYYVYYNHSYAPDVWTKAAIVNDPKRTEVEVKLSPHANYTFRVVAVNDIGESKPSDKSIAACESNSDLPDKHPSNVRTDRSKPGVLIVKWDRMSGIEHNGEGFKYVLSIIKDNKTNKTTISDWEENEKEFDFGVIYEPYEIYVEAYNDVGKCLTPAVIHIGYTGEAEPKTYPTNFELVPGKEVKARSAWFQWDPVNTSPEMMQGEFKGYKVKFWKIDQRETTEKVVMFPRDAPRDTRVKRNSKEMSEVQNLPPYSDIEVEVVACNSFYDSNASNIINVTTPEGVPGPVRLAKVILRGSHHFLIDWRQPLEPNGVLTGYKIGYRKVNGLDVEDITMVEEFNDPGKTRAILNNLTFNQEYTIYIWALTKVGQGEAFYMDAKTANPGPLLQPQIDEVSVGEDYFNVSWKVDPNTDKPAGISHYIQYRKLGDMKWNKREATEDEQLNTYLNVSGLLPNTNYEISVVAVSNTVEVPSALEKITTGGEAVPSLNKETSIAQASWFIGMMVAIVVLILFLLVVCFIKRSRGEKYNVQEREKLGVADPEVPEKDMFNEYPRSGETDPLAAGSPDSFDNDQDKLPGGSETDSMAEYGDVDPSKFNEDGSFIGQYGTQKPEEKGNQPSAMSTFV